MSPTLEIILTIVDFIVALVVILSILFQSSESEGLSGVLAGSAETLFGKDKARSLDSKLSKITTIAVIVFIIITFILCIGSSSKNIAGNVDDVLGNTDPSVSQTDIVDDQTDGNTDGDAEGDVDGDADGDADTNPAD